MGVSNLFGVFYFSLRDLRGDSWALNQLTSKSHQLATDGGIFNVVYQCEGLIVDCSLKGERIACCDLFKPINTEVGLCYSFNSRHAHTRNSSIGNLKFNILHIHETDEKWSLEFNVAPLNLGNKKDEKAPVMPIKVITISY
ncbi:unnamed protein product [Timema podura]|uniref:Uncharacterized protein n=1 Tax=Timema podura TaxID=61482 RepID=A0ABN7P0N2_TIMPD|nr:unnamed protein product [Timema podura]